MTAARITVIATIRMTPITGETALSDFLLKYITLKSTHIGQICFDKKIVVDSQ
jgi:hypothetical protein